MLHEAYMYHVTIKSSRFVKFLQAFEKSADWVLLIGVTRGASGLPPNFWNIFSFCSSRSVVSNQILFLAFFLHLQKFVLATSLALLSSLGDDSN